MHSFGETIRKYRDERKLPLRKVAAFLDVDQAILSKIERGQRRANREQVLMLSEFFEIKEQDLLVAWLSDKLVYAVQNEECGIQALQVAESKVTYEKRPYRNRMALVKLIADFFRSDGRVSKAWLFGSFARGEEKAGSDIDLMISYSEKASGTLLDYADITYQLENLLNVKVDLVEEGFVKPFANMNINQDKVLIYG